jgi:hypothetical protein
MSNLKTLKLPSDPKIPEIMREIQDHIESDNVIGLCCFLSLCNGEFIAKGTSGNSRHCDHETP